MKEESRLSSTVEEVQEWEILIIFGDLWKDFMQGNDVVITGFKKITLDTYRRGSVKPESWEFVTQCSDAWTGILLVGMEWKGEF